VLNIASGENKGLMERHREGYIVVETNYRVYAYTTSDLQVALIGLFAEALYRYKIEKTNFTRVQNPKSTYFS
jgi:transcription initiation factor TFIIH subunit 4